MDEYTARSHVLQALLEIQQLVWGLESNPELDSKLGAPGLGVAIDTASKALCTWAQEAGVYHGPGPTEHK